MKIGYTATYDMKCRGLTYEVGASYKCNKLEMCKYGFHYCKNLDDCLDHYDYQPNLKILKIQDLSKNTIKEYNKFCSDHIKVLEVIDNPQFKSIELDEFGRILKKKYPYGHWETYKYDDRGNKIRFKNSYGFWKTFEYDDRGNRVRFKNSNGFWEIYEYDERGNKVRLDTSNGIRKTYEYDEKGNVISKNDFKIEIIKD